MRDSGEKEIRIPAGHPAETMTVWLAILLTLLCYGFCKLTGGLYIDNDNYYVAMVTSGLFDDTNWCYYVNPILSLTIKGLSRLLPEADWFTVLTHGILLAGSAWLFERILKSAESGWKKTAALLWHASLLTCLNLWNINYTVQSAYFCMIGSVALFTGRGEKSGQFLTAAFFLLAGIMWRVEVFFLFVPYLSLKYLAKSLCSRHEDRRPACRNDQRRMIVFAAVFLLVITCHYGVRMLPENREAVRYNQARTALTDYPVLRWEDVPENDLVFREDYEAATQEWCFLDTEVLNAETLTKLAELGRRTLSFRQALFRLTRTLEQNKWKLLVPSLWILVLFLTNCLCCGRIAAAESLLALGGTAVIALFFAKLGRIPVSVLLSLMLACSFSLYEDRSDAERTGFRVLQTCMFGAFAAVCLSMLVMNGAGKALMQPQWAVRSREHNTNNALYSETVNGTDLYFWDTSSYHVRFYMNSGKLMDREYVKHNLTDGGWEYGQPYLVRLLESLDAANPAKALVTREHTYYVTEDSDFILRLLRNHYGADIQAEAVGVLPGESRYWRLFKEPGE